MKRVEQIYRITIFIVLAFSLSIPHQVSAYTPRNSSNFTQETEQGNIQFGDYLIYQTKKGLVSQALDGSDKFSLGGRDFEAIMQIPALDSYDISQTALEWPLDQNYGFYHGVWSPGRDKLVYLALQPGGANYRIDLAVNGREQSETLFAGSISENIGYLEPVAWNGNDQIVLLERFILDNLQNARVYLLSLETHEIEMISQIAVSGLSGKSLVTSSGNQVLLGADLEKNMLYFLDVSTLLIHSTSISLEIDQPVNIESVVRFKPVAIVSSSVLLDLLNTPELPILSYVSSKANRPAPFLYWPLADNIRSVLNYTDSPWTAALGLHTYPDHQGTDLFMNIGTPVYAASTGVIVEIYMGCQDLDPSVDNYGGQVKNCTIGAYPFNSGLGYHRAGNGIMMSHSLTVDGNNRTWYSFYAHLRQNSQTIQKGDLVNRGTKIAESGHSGISSDPHFHFEVRNASTYVDWDDPWGSADSPHTNPDDGTLWVYQDGKIVAANSGGNVCSNPSPNADQVGLYTQKDFCGTVKLFGLGEWANPGAMGFANDSATSIKVGGNVKAVLCRDDNYVGCEEFTSNDSDLSNNGIGTSTSSLKVQSRGSTTGAWTANYYDTIDRWWDTNNSGNFKCSENVGGPTLDKNYGTGAPCGMDGDTWTADYSATISFPSGNYVFLSDHDDALKIWLNGQNIGDYGGSGSDKACPAKYLSGNVNLRALLREDGGDARVKLWWTTDTSVCVQPPGSPTLSLPTNNSTVGRYDNVILSWNSVSGASEYYAEFSGGPSFAVNSGWTSGTSYTVGNTFWGGVYTWRVQARNSAGSSGWSETRTLYRKYGTPSNLTLSGATQTQVSLSWSASADAPGNIDGYRIYRNGSAIATVGSSTTSYLNSGLTCGGSYSYYVRAYKGNLESDSSETRSLSTSSCAAGIPVLINPTDGFVFNEGQSITLSWTDTGDQFYGEISGGPAGTSTFGWQAETTKNIGSQWAGYYYDWKVKAKNSGGESGFSGSRYFIVRPGQPTNLTVDSPSCNQVNLSWSDNSGNEEGYFVYRNNALIATRGSNLTNYQDNNVSGDSTYSYTVYAVRGTITSNASATASITTSVCPPSNDNLSNPIVISSLPYSGTQSTQGATIESAEPYYPVGSSNGSSVWYRFSSPQDGIFAVDTYGSNYDTVLHIFELGSNLTPIQGDDDEPSPNNLQSRVLFTAKSNVTYLISVSHYGNGSGGTLGLNVSQVPCASTSLCVTASSPWYRPLTYYGTLVDSSGQIIQWFPLDSYGFGSAVNLSSGVYTVIISDYGLLKKVEGVIGPGVLGVATFDLPTAIISLKDLGSNAIDAGVTFRNQYGEFNLGLSPATSPMVVYATPDDYLVGLSKYEGAEKYLTYHRSTINPGTELVPDTYDLSQSPAIVYTYHVQTISDVRLILDNEVFGDDMLMNDGEVAVLSFPADMNFLAYHVGTMDDTINVWYYGFPMGTLTIQQFRQERDVYIGGALQIMAYPYESPYGYGDTAQIVYYVMDSHYNYLSYAFEAPMITQTSISALVLPQEAKYDLAGKLIIAEDDNRQYPTKIQDFPKPTDNNSLQVADQITSTVEVLDPSNFLRFTDTKADFSGTSVWNVPNDAELGTWTANVAVNHFGLWQGRTTTTFNFEVKDSTPPSNDDYDTPVVVNQLPFTTSLDTFGATTAPDDPTMPKCGLYTAAASVWYSFTPSQSGTLSANTMGSNYDTVLAVWSGARGNLNLIACNDDRSYNPHDQDSELLASLEAGTTYYIMAGKYDGNLGTNVLSGVSGEKDSQLMTAGAGILKLNLDYSVVGPGLAQPLTPSSTETFRNPTFTWLPGVLSTRYLLRINNGENNTIFEGWLDAMDVCTADLCTYRLEESLGNGNYSWSIRTWNTSGDGPWSSEMQFSVDSLEPFEKKIFLPLIAR